MANYQINSPDGHTYEVTAPDNASQDDVLKYVQAQHTTTPPPAQPSLGVGGTLIDMARSIPGGALQGITSLAGLPTALHQLGEKYLGAGPTEFGTNVIGSLIGAPAAGTAWRSANEATGHETGVTQADLDKALTKPSGGYYVPRTAWGRGAETAASFLPAAIGGPEGLAGRLATRVVAPAALSTVGSEAVPEKDFGSTAHTVAQVGGAILGNLLSGGIGAGLKALASNAATAPEQAARYVAGIAQRANATPNSIFMAGQNAAGRGMTAAEALGPNGVAALGTIGRQPGQTAQALSDALSARAEAMPARLLSDFASASGVDPAAARGDMDSLLAAGRANAKPLFDKALSAPGGLMNDDLVALSNRPVIQRALAQASADLKNAGQDPTAIGLSVGPDGNLVAGAHPTPAAWDLVRNPVTMKPVPDTISRGNYNVGVAGRDLTSALRDAIPGYGDALDASGDYLKVNSAFERGQKAIFNQATTPAQVKTVFDGLSPTEQDAFKGGMANQMFINQQNGRMAPRYFSAPAVKQKLAVALGQDNADTFLKNVATERDLAKSGARMMPNTNSTTGESAFVTADQNDPSRRILGAGYGIGALKDAFTGNLLGAGYRGGKAISYLNLMGHGGMSADVRNAAGQLLAGSPADLARKLAVVQPPAAKNPLLRTAILGSLAGGQPPGPNP